MLERLPFTEIPKCLSHVLCQNSNEAKQAFIEIQRLMNHDNFFHILIERGIKGSRFQDSQKMFHSLGLRNFRNQLTAMYLEFYEKGKYTFCPDLSYIQDLISFEDRFEEYGLVGSNRVFLLAIYLKFSDAHLQSKGRLGDLEFVNPPEEIEKILDMGSSHQENIDYLILLVWQLLEIWGEDELKKKLMVVKGNFQALVNQMSEEDRTKVAATILAYSSSIGLEDIFRVQKKV